MVSKKWKACTGVRALRGGCPERSQESGKHERGPARVNYSKEAGLGRVRFRVGKP
jgi:hypothetical protein